MDYKKLDDCMRRYKKLDKIMCEIFNDKSEVVYAFGSEEEVLKELSEYGLDKTNIISLGYGGYIHKNNFESFVNLNKYVRGIKKQFLDDFYNCCGLFLDNLWNFECRIGGDYERALDELLYYKGLDSIKDMEDSLIDMLNLTIDYYNKEFDKINGY